MRSTDYEVKACQTFGKTVPCRTQRLRLAWCSTLFGTGAVRGGTVMGGFGEAFYDVHHFFRLTSAAAAEKNWRSMGARSQAEARSVFWIVL